MRGSRALLLLGLPLAAAAVFVACGDDGGGQESRERLTQAEKRLLETPLPEILTEAFPNARLEQDAEIRLYLAGADSALEVKPLEPRLLGQLDDDPAPEMFALFSLEPESSTDALDGEGGGVYAAVVGEDRSGLSAHALLLSDDASALVPLERAAAANQQPFRQGQQEVETTAAVAPTLVTDVDGDGKEEPVLALRFRRRTISWQEYAIYRPDGEGGWQRIADGRQGSPVPAQAALDYWANVGAGVAIGARWDPETRLTVVWSWLTDETALVMPELVQELEPGGDPLETRDTQEALASLRDFFQEAYDGFSEDFRVLQPWPGFVNGFRNTERVALESLSAPDFQEDGDATVDTVIVLSQQEGQAVVARRFRTTFEVKAKTDGSWLLDGVEAQELREKE